MPDILLIQPPIRDFYLTLKRTLPYGLTCIAAALEKAGYDVELFDTLATTKTKRLDWPGSMAYLQEFFGKPDASPFALFHHYRHFGYSFEHIGHRARQSGAFLIGISSLFTAYEEQAVQCAESIKKVYPQCKIVMGGHHPTAMPDVLMQHRAVDYVIRGEGEVSMPLLAHALQKGTALHTIPGIVFRRQNGTLFISDPAEISTLDACPPPAMNLVKHGFYQRHRKGSMIVVGSRGCPMRCSYCCMGASSLRYRRRRVESVIKEIEQAVGNYHVRFIDFEDENISLDKNWFMSLLKSITEHWKPLNLELRAMNGLFPPSLNEQMIAAMKSAGFKTLNLSLGTRSPKQLIRFRRPDVTAAVENALAWAEKYHLEAVCYIIAGAPGQMAGDSLEDLLYLCRRRVLAGVSIYYPSPGSHDYETAAARGLLPNTTLLMRSSAIPISDTTNRLESVTLLRLGRIVNFIKSMVDAGLPLPSPRPLHSDDIITTDDRFTAGIRLLQRFLHDGIICGITVDGKPFEHRTESTLTRTFIDKLKNIPIRGITSNSSTRFSG